MVTKMNWKAIGTIYGPGEKPNLARRLMLVFQQLGPAFIKLGQIISMVPALPRSFQTEFTRLCDYLPAESFENVRALLEKELGVPPEDVFEWIDPDPLGAASLAQVHAAVLREEGEDCVFKIQRPNLKPLFERDYRCMDPIAGFMKPILIVVGLLYPAARDIDPVEIVREYGEATAVDETDFGLEATMMQMFTNANERHGLVKDLYTTHVFWKYTTDNLITMQRVWTFFKFVDIDVGNPKDIFAYLNFLKELGYHPDLALKKGHMAWWYPFARYGVGNMDVHHGNFLFCYTDNLALVDFGIFFYGGSTEYNDLCRMGTVGFWGCVMKADYSGVVGTMQALGLAKELSDDELMERVSIEMAKTLDPVMHVTEREGATGGFIVDVMDSIKDPAFIGSMLGGFNRLLIQLGGLEGKLLGYEMMGLLRQIPYWGTWMQIIDPNWNLFEEGDSLNAYWFGDYDGTVPYAGTNILPTPKLPYEPEILHEIRSLEMRRSDDFGLCIESTLTM